MKPLILYVTADAVRGRTRATRLGTRYNVTISGPEEGLFHLLSARFTAVVLCSSIPKRKLLPLSEYLQRTLPETPVVYLRTGRERHTVAAGILVAEKDEKGLLRAIDLSTQHRAMAARKLGAVPKSLTAQVSAVAGAATPLKARVAGQE